MTTGNPRFQAIIELRANVAQAVRGTMSVEGGLDDVRSAAGRVQGEFSDLRARATRALGGIESRLDRVRSAALAVAAAVGTLGLAISETNERSREITELVTEYGVAATVLERNALLFQQAGASFEESLDRVGDGLREARLRAEELNEHLDAPSGDQYNLLLDVLAQAGINARDFTRAVEQGDQASADFLINFVNRALDANVSAGQIALALERLTTSTFGETLLGSIITLRNQGLEPTSELVNQLADDWGTLDAQQRETLSALRVNTQQASTELYNLRDAVVASIAGFLPDEWEGMVAAIAGIGVSAVQSLAPTAAFIALAIKGGVGVSIAWAPVTAVILGVTAAVAAGIIIWRNWDTIAATVTDTIGTVRDAVGSFGDLWHTVWDGIVVAMLGYVRAILTPIDLLIRGLNAIPGFEIDNPIGIIDAELRERSANIQDRFADNFAEAQANQRAREEARRAAEPSEPPVQNGQAPPSNIEVNTTIEQVVLPEGATVEELADEVDRRQQETVQLSPIGRLVGR